MPRACHLFCKISENERDVGRGLFSSIVAGGLAMNLYSGPRKGRSSSSAPATNMIRPSPSSNLAIWTTHEPLGPSAARCPAVGFDGGVRTRPRRLCPLRWSCAMIVGLPPWTRAQKTSTRQGGTVLSLRPGGSHLPLPCATCLHCSLSSTVSIYRSHRRLWTSSMTQMICQMSPRC